MEQLCFAHFYFSRRLNSPQTNKTCRRNLLTTTVMQVDFFEKKLWSIVALFARGRHLGTQAENELFAPKIESIRAAEVTGSSCCSGSSRDCLRSSPFTSDAR